VHSVTITQVAIEIGSSLISNAGTGFSVASANPFLGTFQPLWGYRQGRALVELKFKAFLFPGGSLSYHHHPQGPGGFNISSHHVP
jgi:hypothetical protein